VKVSIRAGLLNDAAARYQLYDYHDHGQDEQQVNKSAKNRSRD
jgi:hypothetical protein